MHLATPLTNQSKRAKNRLNHEPCLLIGSPFSADCHAIPDGYLILQNILSHQNNPDKQSLFFLNNRQVVSNGLFGVLLGYSFQISKLTMFRIVIWKLKTLSEQNTKTTNFLPYENTSNKTYHTNAYTLVLHYTSIEISNADSFGIIYLLKKTTLSMYFIYKQTEFINPGYWFTSGSATFPCQRTLSNTIRPPTLT